MVQIKKSLTQILVKFLLKICKITKRSLAGFKEIYPFLISNFFSSVRFLSYNKTSRSPNNSQYFSWKMTRRDMSYFCIFNRGISTIYDIMILHVFSQMKLLNPISGIASDMKYMRTGEIQNQVKKKNI